MASKNLLLPEKWISLVLKFPETGMGYHIANIILKNGRVLKKHKIINSSVLVLEDNESINLNDIDNIQITK